MALHNVRLSYDVQVAKVGLHYSKFLHCEHLIYYRF